ncbi:serine/threonine protein kinase [Streptomyces sp. NBC_01381]|uniref:serine/threonine-protein kinase n=1 Tax=Streptomyces sp. NBC_01381 TaxID=2903845 RepID=UPI00225AE2E7|nr:serine/threonine-protein kinase [Streptomyces sp. NBC_01381]MCX4669317.1 serine/threonine protein kinase [Streptomyces sp. NBC_01381]
MSDAEKTGQSRQDKSERLLSGRYRLGEVLGRGGMGTVWRAKDETLGRTVAVKELRFPSSIDEDEKRRLITRTLREAKAIARIRNTSAVTVYDVVDEDDRPWIVMELVEGKSLAEAIREDGLLTPRRAAEVGLAVLDVLRSAHREGILHRDVKPSNVLIAEDGRVVLTDFGIAQVEGDPSITSTGMLVGAPSYISPERARGHKPGPAADLWSLGGLLYASVEGVPPYDKGSAIATLTAVMTEDVEQPTNAGPLEKVIYGLLAKDPELRLDDAAARALLLDVIHAPEVKDEPEPVEATKVVPLPPAPPEKRAKAARSPRVGMAKRFGKGGSGRGAGAAAAGAAGAAAGSAAVGAPGKKGTDAPSDAAATASATDTAAAGKSGDVSTASDAADSGAGAGTSGAGSAGKGKKSEEAAERLRGALQSVRKAAATAAAAASTRGAATNAGTAAGHPEGAPPVPAAPPRGPAKASASLTDVVPRRTLVIISVVVVLAVLGTVLALALGGGDDGGARDSKGGDKAASSGATAGGGEKDPEKDGGAGQDGGAEKEKDKGKEGSGAGTDPASDAGEGQDPGTGDDGGKEPDDGADSTYKHSQGFAIGLPKGWKYQSTAIAGARFSGPDGQKLLIGWTTTPKDDPVADWKNQESGMVRSQYKRIRIEKVGFRGWNTADWEFTYVDGGTKYRSIDRGFVVNGGLGYGMMYTAKADDWDSDRRKDTWRTFTRTFEPKK